MEIAISNDAALMIALAMFGSVCFHWSFRLWYDLWLDRKAARAELRRRLWR
jgi:hypothetical protein